MDPKCSGRQTKGLIVYLLTSHSIEVEVHLKCQRWRCVQYNLFRNEKLYAIIHPSNHLSIYLSIQLSIYLSICLSLPQLGTSKIFKPTGLIILENCRVSRTRQCVTGHCIALTQSQWSYKANYVRLCLVKRVAYWSPHCVHQLELLIRSMQV